MVKKAVYNDLVREGVLALSCLMLDRINGAFAHPVEEEWYRGGKEKVEAWKEKLKEIKE
jgi:hypothetical protein